MLVGTFLFLSVSTRDKRDEINIFVAGDPCRKEYPIERIYGDSFLDITDLNQLPTKLTGVVKRHIRV